MSKRALFLAALLLGGCSSGSSSGPVVRMVPDFLLEDVNPTSLTFNAMVSPRDQLGGVSAWYFGSAT